MNATDVLANVTEEFSASTQKNKFWTSVFGKESRISAKEVLIIISYSAIFIMSTFGNLLVFSIVIRNASLRSAKYVFIANLALSDLLMTVLNIPFNVVGLLLNNWPFGDFMCSLVPLMQVTFVYVSTFTMTCIAVDRYRIISKPLRPKMAPMQAFKTIICIWISAAILSLPHAIFSEVDSFFTYRPLTRCRSVYPENMSTWITLTSFITQYILPLSVTGILYCIIVAKIWSRNTLGVVTEAQLISQAKSKNKTIKMLIRVVIVFAMCWLPLNVFYLLHEFNAFQFIYKSSTPTTIFFICHWLAMSSLELAPPADW
ncbi:putative G-protein coupled receptor 83 like protein [Argiope bruennichi]|uniref:Putative G-protein coupled receptor 83 like protein n=1 Tax=Argiope bruennichi TaxID=94029 RepID=A0A8T0FMX6_ARGBR|nr:putative G-protein coupled receptor 83 like protein [Argiope bruennichi]